MRRRTSRFSLRTTNYYLRTLPHRCTAALLIVAFTLLTTLQGRAYAAQNGGSAPQSAGAADPLCAINARLSLRPRRPSVAQVVPTLRDQGSGQAGFRLVDNLRRATRGLQSLGLCEFIAPGSSHGNGMLFSANIRTRLW